MKLCFPVAADQGMESMVYGHFGSAPHFIVVDTETDVAMSLGNRDDHHAQGSCDPLRTLGGNRVDAVVVGGIGAGALSMMRGAGVKVFRTQAATVGENVALFKRGTFMEIAPAACQGHGHGEGGGCH